MSRERASIRRARPSASMDLRACSMTSSMLTARWYAGRPYIERSTAIPKQPHSALRQCGGLRIDPCLARRVCRDGALRPVRAVETTAVKNREPCRPLRVCVPRSLHVTTAAQSHRPYVVRAVITSTVADRTQNRPDGRTQTMVPAGTGADTPRWSCTICQHPRYGVQRESNAAGVSCAIAGADESSASMAASINLLVICIP